MTELRSLAQALGGDVCGQQVLCPGPGHSPRDRSLSVRLAPTSLDGFVIFSHAGDEVGACKDHVRARMGWQRPARGEQPAAWLRPPHTPDDETAAKIARATAIWNEARDPRGTLVERYLASRGLVLPDQASGEAIRFHPRCPWRDEVTGETIRVPAMVAAMRSLTTEEIIGVHRTRLTEDGRKVDRRMLGKAAGSAIMLCPMSAIAGGLVIGEGIETCLAGWQLGWGNVWALGSVGAIQNFPLINALDSLVLLAETGDNGASARAIEIVGERYATAGREVIIVEPRCDGDLNDVLMGSAA